MDTESQSIEVESLKRALLQPQEPSTLGQPESEYSTFDNITLQAVRAAYEQLSPLRPRQRTSHSFPPTANQPESWPILPGTVPDSQSLLSHAKLDSQQFQFIHPAPPAPTGQKNNPVALKKMNQISQGATQELSPSHFESIIHKSRSEGQFLEDADCNEYQQNETQATYQEGDPGHVNLLSIYDQGPQRANPDSDPADDFSPTQSERALSQFPESQRFKTPATAGKKRRYNGDVVDTPHLPRNPLRRQSAQSNVGVMGLSQAFAATQADTSPFVPNVLPELQSDRPSPTIELQPHPATLATSSPMRLLPEFQRASTEPASRYVPMRFSQAERDRLAEIRRQQDMAQYEADSDDELDDERSQSMRTRIRGVIERRVRATLEQISSPSKTRPAKPSIAKSSPIRGQSSRSPMHAMTARSLRYTPESSPLKSLDAELDNDSEVETEQEDNGDIAVTRSSQAAVAMEAEDKENLSEPGSQVPETAARLQQVMNGLPSQVEESPSVRPLRGPCTIVAQGPIYSSEPFAVADSQPSQTRAYRQPDLRIARSSAGEGVDFVPQSPTASPRRTLESQQPMSPESVVEDDPATGGDEPSLLIAGASTLTDRATVYPRMERSRSRRSTIPESSPNEQEIQSIKTSRQVVVNQNPSTASTGDDYETAASHIPAPAVGPGDARSGEIDLSSPPIINTPPGRKRKRLLDIAAEPSPQKSQSQSSFNANDALRLDVDLQPDLDLHPIKFIPVIPQPKRRRVVIKFSGENQIENDGSTRSTPEQLSQRTSPSEFANHAPSGPDGMQTAAERLSSSAPYSRRDRKPSAKALRTRGANALTQPAAMRSARATKWDVEVSPPQTAVPVIRTLRITQPVQNTEVTGESTEAVAGLGISNEVQADPEPTGNVNAEPEQQASAELTTTTYIESNQITGESADEPSVAPNMVFACFNGKARAYHPALCLGPTHAKSKRFVIQWDGGYAPDEIDEYGIRRLDLRIGDLVKVNSKGFPKVPYIVKGFKNRICQQASNTNPPLTDIRGHEKILIVPKQRKSLPAEISTDTVREVLVSEIYLDSNMWGQMKDRIYEYNSTSAKGTLPGFTTPAEHASTPATPTSRSRRAAAAGAALPPAATIPSNPTGLFAYMAFAISYEDESRRVDLVNLVQENGGYMLEDTFSDLLEPDGFVLKEPFHRYTFAALLTERHSRKEKYMQALALGLPCLNGRWVDECVGADELAPWLDYLLPAGESSALEGAIKSRVLPYMTGAHSTTVKEMIELRPQFLTGTRVVVAIAGKNKTDAKRNANPFLIRALGARVVHFMPDLHSAKSLLEAVRTGNDDDPAPIDLVVVDGQDVDAARAILLPPEPPSTGRKRGKFTSRTQRDQGDEVKIREKEAIVQSLVLGKLWLG